MKIKYTREISQLLVGTMLFIITGNFIDAADAIAITNKPPIVSNVPTISNGRFAISTKQSNNNVKPKYDHIREDYFVSSDTVIIGCTSGMAAGILVGTVPVTGAVMSGIGVSESVNLLINLAGMGCGVGAVSSAVAILTAWMLADD